MRIFQRKLARRLLLSGLYALGIFGIFASGGGGGGNGDDSIDCFIDVVRDIEATTDGTNDIWVAAGGDGDPATEVVARLQASGFQVGVFRIGSGGLGDRANAIAIAADGSGDLYVGGKFEKGILRLNSDATLDQGFAVGSGFTCNFAGYCFDVLGQNSMSIESIVPREDGSGDIYVAGLFDAYDGIPVSGIVRLNDDGSLDTGFDGTAVNRGFSAALAQDLTGDIYASGISCVSATYCIGRLNSDGSRDMGFTDVPSGPVNMVITPAVDFTQDVYIGGGVFTAGVGFRNLTRVDQFGAPDNDFVTGSGITGSLVPDLTDPIIRSIEPAPFSAGAIYVGGSFTAYDGNPANGIVRINNDGTQDFNFMTGSGFNGPPEVVEGATDGSTNIYVGGGFGFPSPGYNGTPVRGIVRLREDGSLDNSFAPRITFNNNVCTN